MEGRARCAAIFGLEITADDVVVDIGSGAGGDSLIAGSVGAEVIAVNIDSGELEQLARKMHGSPARSFRAIPWDCNAGPIPLPDATASVVIAKEVMEHLDRPRDFLAELARIGRPGARYLITVPDPSSESLLRIVAPASFWEKPCHQHVFDRGQLDAMIADAGLAIDRRAATGFYWSMLWCLRLAVGTDYFPGDPRHSTPDPTIAAWETIWQTLESTPLGPQVIQRLDELVPKSQIVLARKPIRRRLWRRCATHLRGMVPRVRATTDVTGSRA